MAVNKPKASGLSAHDNELLRAKNDGKNVRVVLTQETYFTDEDSSVLGKIEYVDRYAIKLSVMGAHKGVVWVTKQAILSTESLA